MAHQLFDLRILIAVRGNRLVKAHGDVVDVFDEQGNRRLGLLDNFVEHQFAALGAGQFVGPGELADAGVGTHADQHRDTDAGGHARQPEHAAHAQGGQPRGQACGGHAHHRTRQVHRRQWRAHRCGLG
ncbi:hypothetical protein D3C72_1849120 [compost metagenome]